jgi:penicillin-binding protein 1A
MHWFKKVCYTGLNLLCAAIIMLAIYYVYLSSQLPNIHLLSAYQLQIPMQVFSQDGQLLGEFGEKHRVPIKINEIPKPLIQAILATEDKNFFSHQGVDFLGLLRAGKKLLLTGRKAEGASTITMQVARNMFLSRKKTFSRKIAEIVLALKIEHEFSKDQILELYLNRIFFGEQSYGVRTAARNYYGLQVKDLNLAQMAMLAGLPKAPSRNNPIVNPAKAKERRNHVLKRMLQRQHIDQQTYEATIQAPVTAKHHGINLQIPAEHIAEMVREAMITTYGVDAYKTGLKIYTTIDSHAQTHADETLASGLLTYDKRHGYRMAQTNLLRHFGDNQALWKRHLRRLPTIHHLHPAVVQNVEESGVEILLGNNDHYYIDQSHMSWALKDRQLKNLPTDILNVGDLIYVQKNQDRDWELSQHPEIEGALVLLDPNTGAIKALVGGYSYNRSHFNRAVQAERQIGSILKPFIYAAALDSAQNITLSTIMHDAPLVQEDSGEHDFWRPKNVTAHFLGPMRVRRALEQSRNLISIRLLSMIGIPYARDYLEAYGFNKSKQPHSLSLALGAGTASPLEIASSYAQLARLGRPIAPYLIERIENQKNQVLLQGPTFFPLQEHPMDSSDPEKNSKENTRITEESSYLIHKVLQNIIWKGTARRLASMGRHDIAGKTGTTNDQQDTWFAGYSPNYVATVWVGFDQNNSTHEFGSTLPLPIWKHFMSKILDGQEEQQLTQPETIIQARIDAKTGYLASPGEKNAIFEYFQKDHLPPATVITKKNKNPIADDEDERFLLTQSLF